MTAIVRVPEYGHEVRHIIRLIVDTRGKAAHETEREEVLAKTIARIRGATSLLCRQRGDQRSEFDKLKEEGILAQNTHCLPPSHTPTPLRWPQRSRCDGEREAED